MAQRIFFRREAQRSPEQYKDVLQMHTLKSVRVGFGSRKRNETFAELAIRYGKNLDAGGKLAEKFIFAVRAPTFEASRDIFNLGLW